MQPWDCIDIGGHHGPQLSTYLLDLLAILGLTIGAHFDSFSRM